MGDGYYHYGDGRCGFGTDSFNYSEHVIIKKWLKKRFGIDSQIHKRAKNNSLYYTIILPKEQADKFLGMVEPYIVPSLCYKLGHLKEENSLKITLHNNKVIEYRKLEYQRNKDKYLKHNHIYYKSNKDKIIKQKRKYYLLNKEKILKGKKEYHLKNREIIIKKQRLYYQNNKDKFKDYYERNKEIIN